jgi:2-dehydro-3-deoxyphosphooctonate aldolase (KDO 8-P synthase)
MFEARLNAGFFIASINVWEILLYYFCSMKNYQTTLFQQQQHDPNNFFLIAGPCVVEDEQMVFDIAEKVAAICNRLEIPYIFKASYRKANRTSATSFTGIGDEKALSLIKAVGDKLNLPVTTDIHTAEEAAIAANFVDILQIPAFLCRQTDLLLAAAATQKIVNVKKGQFVSGQAMKFAVEKINQAGNDNVWLTERGNSFGYQDLIVDYRNITWMKALNVPVIMYCTHSLQQPNQTSGITGGNPSLIETIAKAAIATGADGLFIETHPNPSKAKSDGANMLHLDLLEALLEKLVVLRKAVI